MDANKKYAFRNQSGIEHIVDKGVTDTKKMNQRCKMQKFTGLS